MSEWNDRYRTDEFVFGTAPNDFLAEVASRIPPGSVLCLGEGEGRNGVHLASLGYEVTGVDASDVGLAKARTLAAARGVALETVVANLATFDLGEDRRTASSALRVWSEYGPELMYSQAMRQVSIQDLKAQLSSAVAEAEAGGTLLITRHGESVARLGPAGPQHTRRGNRVGVGALTPATRRSTSGRYLAVLREDREGR